jgi:hypothetical protein
MSHSMHMRTMLRLFCPLALVAVAGLLAACGGGSDKQAAPGSKQNPLVGRNTPGAKAQSSEAGKAGAPGYQKLLERQTSKPASNFTPCNLVSKAQAQAIMGARIQDPLEAPQGPTCIYRTRDGKSFITLAVQPVKFATLKRQLADRKPVAISNRTAYCGRYGQSMLYMPLSGGRVLSVSARCRVAKQFALTALGRLKD